MMLHRLRSTIHTIQYKGTNKFRPFIQFATFSSENPIIQEEKKPKGYQEWPTNAQDWIKHFKSLSKQKHPIRKSKFTKYMNCIENKEDLQAVQTIMEIYEKKRCDPYPNIIQRFIEKGNELKHPDIVFNVIKDTRLRLFLKQRQCKKLMYSLLKYRYFEQVEEFFQYMTTKLSIYPHRIMVDYLVQSAVRQGDIDKGFDILKHITDTNLHGRANFNIIMGKYKNDGDFKKALEVYHIMQAVSVTPNVATVAILKEMDARDELAKLNLEEIESSNSKEIESSNSKESEEIIPEDVDSSSPEAHPEDNQAVKTEETLEDSKTQEKL